MDTLTESSYLEVTYILYLVISILVTVWVGRTLFKRGRVFLVDAFKNEAVADSINHLLLVGFYLINIGYISVALKSKSSPQSLSASIELLSSKVGWVLLILGGMHFFNIFILRKIGKSRNTIKAEEK